MTSKLFNLYRQYSKLEARTTLYTELLAFLKDRSALYTAQAEELHKKYDAKTATPEEENEFIRKQALLLEYSKYESKILTEQINNMQEFNKVTAALLYEKGKRK